MPPTAQCLQHVLTVVIILSGVMFSASDGQRGPTQPPRLQPELDMLDVSYYFRNDRLVKLQLMCAFYDGPCDIAGRWIKPRIIPGLFDQCPNCTEHQKEHLSSWLNIFADKYPILFRAIVAQWLIDNDYPVPDSEIPRIQRAMGFNSPAPILRYRRKPYTPPKPTTRSPFVRTRPAYTTTTTKPSERFRRFFDSIFNPFRRQ